MTFVLFEYRRDKIPLKKTSISVLNSVLPKRFLYIGNVLIISFSGTDCTVLSVPCILNILSTYGDRAFPVAAVRIWNSLL